MEEKKLEEEKNPEEQLNSASKEQKKSDGKATASGSELKSTENLCNPEEKEEKQQESFPKVGEYQGDDSEEDLEQEDPAELERERLAAEASQRRAEEEEKLMLKLDSEMKQAKKGEFKDVPGRILEVYAVAITHEKLVLEWPQP